MTPHHAPVSVIGLGAMGRALATAFVTAGHPTTVWNRSRGRADDLVRAGAVEVPTLAAALDPGGLTVICLLDRAAVDEVIDAGGPSWRDAQVVNLTSSTPDDARAVDERLRALGAAYLDGTVMVTTDHIGTAGSHVLFSGDTALFATHRSTLAALGGSNEMLGAEPGLAASYDVAMLDLFFTGMAAFLHATALAEADGIPAGAFLPYAKRMIGLLDDSLDGLAADVDRGEHDGSQDNLVMELVSLDHIVTTSRSRGLDTELPATVRALAHRSIAAGHGADSFSRVIDAIRPRTDTSLPEPL